MILDSKQQKEIILQLIDTATFKGSGIDDMYTFKKQVEEATVKEITTKHSNQY